MDYSSEVRRRFRAPARAGELPPDAGDVVEGTAEDRSLNVWVRFQVQHERQTIRQVRFRAFGCPHTLAAADWAAEWLEGRAVDALTAVDWSDAAALGVPRDKAGKLLRVEDALASCKASINAKD